MRKAFVRRERESASGRDFYFLFFLRFASFSDLRKSDRRFSSGLKEKLIHPARATRGYQNIVEIKQSLLKLNKRGAGQAPHVFDQRAFAEAVGVEEASAAGSQGGSSNLQRFKSHHSPTFTRGGDSMVAEHWFRKIRKVLQAMDISSDVAKIRLAAFQLEGES